MANEDIELMNEFYSKVFDALFISYAEYLLDKLEKLRNSSGELRDILHLLRVLGANSIKYHAKNYYHRKATAYIMGYFKALDSLETFDSKLKSLEQSIDLESKENDLQIQELIKRMKASSNSFCNQAATDYELSDRYIRTLAEMIVSMYKLEEGFPGTGGRRS